MLRVWNVIFGLAHIGIKLHLANSLLVFVKYRGKSLSSLMLSAGRRFCTFCGWDMSKMDIGSYILPPKQNLKNPDLRDTKTQIVVPWVDKGAYGGEGVVRERRVRENIRALVWQEWGCWGDSIHFLSHVPWPFTSCLRYPLTWHGLLL